MKDEKTTNQDMFIKKYLQKYYNILVEWEYWPATIFYIPIAFYFIYLAVRAKSLFFFSNIDPVMECSDFLDSSKYETYEYLPEELKPKMLLIQATNRQTVEQIVEKMKQQNINFPCIIKPNLGRRGQGIKPIIDTKTLEHYLQDHPQKDLIIQENIERPVEVGLMYVRIPGKKGKITGIMQRNFLTISGDGKHTIGQLVHKHPRAQRYLSQIKNVNTHCRDEILPEGKQHRAMPLGTHSRGTQFLDASNLITKKMEERFDEIAEHFTPGFYFGRYDIRVEKIEDLESGPIKILDVNGAAAEPAHAYDPQYNVFEGYKEFMRHWKQIFLIGKKMKQKGKPYRTLQEFMQLRKQRKQIQTTN